LFFLLSGSVGLESGEEAKSQVKISNIGGLPAAVRLEAPKGFDIRRVQSSAAFCQSAPPLRKTSSRLFKGEMAFDKIASISHCSMK
jgi:hypothetical protein